jgi:aspartyl protease family protein
MTQPILWALTVLGAAGATAIFTVDRLAERAQPRPAEQVSAASMQQGDANLTVRLPTVRLPSDRRGHYIADMSVDGRVMRMLVDTGASLVALRESDARAAGLDGSYTGKTYSLSTANGVVEAKGVRIREMRLGAIIVRDIEAVVLPDAQLSSNLLGMSFLNRLRGFEVSGHELILRG